MGQLATTLVRAASLLDDPGDDPGIGLDCADLTWAATWFFPTGSLQLRADVANELLVVQLQAGADIAIGALVTEVGALTSGTVRVRILE
jgi:hypothetical protein